jgi:hypothetical protein
MGTYASIEDTCPFAMKTEVQRYNRLGLRVGPSPIHGVGTFARRRFTQGTLIGEVHGRRCPQPYSSPTCVGYGDKEVLEPDDTGVPVHLMNHSDQPNCALRYPTPQGLGVGVLRDIEAGEELTIDYAWSPGYARSQGIPVTEEAMATDNLTIALTSEQQQQIEEATGRHVPELTVQHYRGGRCSRGVARVVKNATSSDILPDSR